MAARFDRQVYELWRFWEDWAGAIDTLETVRSARWPLPLLEISLLLEGCLARHSAVGLMAVSPVIARLPFRISVTRFVGTWSCRASSAALMPSSFRSSARCSP